MVTPSPAKNKKYCEVIWQWFVQDKHNLKHMQELDRKLLHTAAVSPQGQSYLTGLESMLATCTSKPFTLHCPDKWIWDDLKWWQKRHKTNTIPCPITPPFSYLDIQAFSDASTCYTKETLWSNKGNKDLTLRKVLTKRHNVLKGD